MMSGIMTKSVPMRYRDVRLQGFARFRSWSRRVASLRMNESLKFPGKGTSAA